MNTLIMKIINFLLLTFIFMSTFAQKQGKYYEQINKLRSIEAMPYGPELSGDSLFWNLTKEKLAIVPFLIERIDDTTQTNAPVPYFSGNYAIGDICIRAIEEIIKEFPTVKLITNNDNEVKEKGYGVYWDYVKTGLKNRRMLKQKVKQWYAKNRNRLTWYQDDKLYAASDSKNAQLKRRPAGGYYIIKK